MKHKYWLEAVLLCGVMQSAPAQSILKNKDEKELSLLLNEVVVTGTGTEHYLKDAPRADRGAHGKSAGAISGAQHRRPSQRAQPFPHLP